MRIVRSWRSSHHRAVIPIYEALVGAGAQIGYEHSFIHQAADFIDSLESGKPAAPIPRGFATDQVTGATSVSDFRSVGQPSHSHVASG